MDVHAALQVLQLHFISVHFVYALIHDRMQRRFHSNCFSIRLEELKKLMANADIRLSPNTWETFQQSLFESGIYDPSENRIFINLLLSAAQSLRQRYEEDCTNSRHIQQLAKLHETSRQLSSTAIRYIIDIQPRWENIRRHLLRNSSNKNISLSSFTHSLLTDAGIVMTAKDIQELWRYIAYIGNYDWEYENERDLLLPIELFDKVMRSPEVDYSSLGAVMREPVERPHGLKSVDPSPNKEDHVTALLISEDYVPTKIPSYRSAFSAFPWQEDEEARMSNVRRRVIDALQQAG